MHPRQLDVRRIARGGTTKTLYSCPPSLIVLWGHVLYWGRGWGAVGTACARTRARRSRGGGLTAHAADMRRSDRRSWRSSRARSARCERRHSVRCLMFRATPQPFVALPHHRPALEPRVHGLQHTHRRRRTTTTTPTPTTMTTPLSSIRRHTSAAPALARSKTRCRRVTRWSLSAA